MILASCQQGQGCACRLSGLTLAGAIVTLGLEGGIFETTGGSMTISAERPDSLHRRYGGGGNCVIALFDPVVPGEGRWNFAQRPPATRLPQIKAMAARWSRPWRRPAI